MDCTMNERPKRILVGCLLPLSFSFLLLVVLLCVLSPATEEEASVLAVARAQRLNRISSLDYQTGVSICAQTTNLVPNHSFEEGGGDPWKPDEWREDGPCDFFYDDAGFDSTRSVQIVGSSEVTNCKLRTPLDEIYLEPRPYDYSSYDYSARVKADLGGGDAYLRIRFSDGQGEYKGEAYTEHVTDTNDKWITVTGSVTVPADVEYARVEATLAGPSAASVWFDDIRLGLATCLEITKSTDLTTATPGEVLTYTIVYSNFGRERATDVEIIETYDDYVSFGGANPDPFAGTENIWKVPLLPPGISDTIVITVVVDSDTGDRAHLVNDFQILSDETLKPVYHTINITLDGDGCDIARYMPIIEQMAEPGDHIDYDLVLHNTGSHDGEADLIAVSSQGWGINFTPEPPYDDMSSGSSEEVIVNLFVPPDAPGGTVDVTLITATLACALPCTETATATATVTTTIVPISPTNVIVDGTSTGHVSATYAFTASIVPVTANRPVTYLWRAAGQAEVTTTTDAPSHTVLFTWGTTGTKTIVVTATNALSTVTSAPHVITVTPGIAKIYLPLVLRNWPPMSQVHPIDNADIDGDYDVCWSDAAPPGYHYVLEESTNSACTGATPVYTDTNTCYSVTDKAAGWYYYQVRVCDGSQCFWPSNCEGVGAWWEREPNNGCSQANGPIRSGSTYSGTFTTAADTRDYFSFDLNDTPRSVELWLTNIPPGCDYDVALCGADCEVVDDCYSNEYGNANEHVRCNLSQTGTYKVRVYYYVTGCSEPYHLRVVYQ